jgi:hypothetical protein
MVYREQILINSSNYVKPNKYLYRFPQPVKFNKNSKVSLFSFSMYNSTYNISQALANNTFSVIWINNLTYNFVIPDGYYSYLDLNNFISYCLLSNLLYLKTTSNPVYPISIAQNSVQYAAQINILYIPSSIQATTLGYSLPTGATWTFPASPTTPQLLISTGLQSILGFQDGQSLFPLTKQTTNQSFISSNLPIISPVYCYILTCNLVENKFNNVPTLFAQVPINVSYGGLLNFISLSLSQIDIREGFYSEIQIALFDQNYNNLQFRDFELTLVLLIDEDK